MTLYERIKVELALEYVAAMQAIGADGGDWVLDELEVEAEVSGYNAKDDACPYTLLNTRGREYHARLVKAWHRGGQQAEKWESDVSLY